MSRAGWGDNDHKRETCLHGFKDGIENDMGRKDPTNWQPWKNHGLAPHRTCVICGAMIMPGEKAFHEGHYREAVIRLAKEFNLTKSQKRLIIQKMQKDRDFVKAVQAYSTIPVSDIQRFIPTN